MRVVAKDVFARSGKGRGAVKTGGEIGCEERPYFQATEKLRSVGESARIRGFGK